MIEKTPFSNSGRQVELDIARGLAVFFMIAVHVLEVLADITVVDSWFGLVVGFLGGPPAAPVFMVLLGVGIVYGTQTTPRILAVRGLTILGLGYLLNALRGGVPALIAVGAGELALQSVLIEILSVDIFQFAGLAFLFFAVWRRMGVADNRMIIAICLVIAVNAIVLQRVGGSSDWSLAAKGISGLFWGSSTISYFPFLSWIIYPMFGYLFGTVLIRTTDKRRLYRITGLTGLAVCIGGVVIGAGVLGIDIGQIDDYSYYHHGVAGTVTFTGFVMAWLSVIFRIGRRSRGIVKKTLTRWSRNVSSIYFIHWVLIGWSTVLIGEGSLGPWAMLIVILILTAVSDAIAVAWNRYNRSVKNATPDT